MDNGKYDVSPCLGLFLKPLIVVFYLARGEVSRLKLIKFFSCLPEEGKGVRIFIKQTKKQREKRKRESGFMAWNSNINGLSSCPKRVAHGSSFETGEIHILSKSKM